MEFITLNEKHTSWTFRTIVTIQGASRSLINQKFSLLVFRATNKWRNEFDLTVKAASHLVEL